MKTHAQRKNLGLWTIMALLLAAAAGQAKGVVCKVELDRAVLPADSEQTAVIKISLDAPPPPKDRKRPPVNLCIVLDRSGSMGGTKIEKAKEAAIVALRRLQGDDMFSLVIYDHRVETLVPAQSARNSEWIEKRIRRINTGGNTALFGGVSQGAAEVRKHIENSRYVHRIILLSDGLANCGPSSPADLARLGAALIKEGISVTTIGVGTDYNEDLMTQLAQRSDGNTYFVESSRDLPRIFSAELGDVLSIVASKVILEINCPAGTRPLRIIGREGRILGNKVEIYLNQLYGGQEKYALLEVTVPATGAGQVREIASARCRYQNAITLQPVAVEARAQARFSASEKDVLRSANAEVQAELGRNMTAIVQDQAVELNDAGKKDEAVRLIKKQSKELRRLGQKFQNNDLVQQAEQLAGQAKQVEQQGINKRSRKAMRSSSFQIRNQQMAQ